MHWPVGSLGGTIVAFPGQPQSLMLDDPGGEMLLGGQLVTIPAWQYVLAEQL